MKSLFLHPALLGLAALAAGCSTVQPCAAPAFATVTDVLVGDWKLASEIPGGLPCVGGATLSLAADGTLTSQSGLQQVFGTYAALPKGDGFLILTVPDSHNGKANCQGYSGDFVVENNIPVLYIEVDGDKGNLYMGLDASGLAVSLVRTEAPRKE